jgi:hypothetical protein
MIFQAKNINHKKKGFFSSSDVRPLSEISLPNGIVEIELNPFTKQPIEGVCFFTKKKTQCILVTMGGGWSQVSYTVCADILITMKEMSYDFTNKDAIKKAKKKEGTESIVKKYNELLMSNPELFNEGNLISSREKLENFHTLHNALTQSLTKKYRNNKVDLTTKLANEIEGYFTSKKFGYFGTVTPKVEIETALNDDKYIKAFSGALINTWGNTQSTAISVVITKSESEVHISCGMTGNYGILNAKSLAGAVLTGGVSFLGNIASNVKDKAHIKQSMDYIDDLMNNFFKEQNSIPTSQPTTEMSILEKIKQLAMLKEQGILTDDEFNRKKTELLAKL